MPFPNRLTNLSLQATEADEKLGVPRTPTQARHTWELPRNVLLINQASALETLQGVLILDAAPPSSGGDGDQLPVNMIFL